MMQAGYGITLHASQAGMSICLHGAEILHYRIATFARMVCANPMVTRQAVTLDFNNLISGAPNLALSCGSGPTRIENLFSACMEFLVSSLRPLCYHCLAL